ncbi:MAG: hypothetical protein RIB70_08085 [Roseitalea porphyridii]|uniref:hypothetical protein n=1 Tax=Roseitalea porphyridii TaxID=1852022 RepID=UPI0032EDDBEB
MAQAAKIEISPTEAPTAASAADSPAIAVLFRNGKDTPRGAWFPADEIEAVLAGAAEMGMHAVKASTAEIISLVQRLPKGRIFDSGKLFTPLIQGKVYDELMMHVPEHGITAKPRLVMSAASSGTGDADAEGPGASVPEGTRPTDWSQITVGSLVLAEEARMEGWFESIVLEVRPKDVFILKFRDYPDDPIITRHISRLALMMQVETAKTA